MKTAGGASATGETASNGSGGGRDGDGKGDEDCGGRNWPGAGYGEVEGRLVLEIEVPVGELFPVDAACDNGGTVEPFARRCADGKMH